MFLWGMCITHTLFAAAPLLLRIVVSLGDVFLSNKKYIKISHIRIVVYFRNVF